jgi:DNA-binding MarR family transcriptional regulator
MKTQPRLTYLIRRAQLIVYTGLTDCLREYNLTPMQYLLLSLSRRRGEMSSADLARRFAVTPQSMNEMITALRRKRLITRRRSTEHRRILRIHLTPAGERLLSDCDLRVDSLEKSLFAELSAAEKRSFRHLLTVFINSAEPDRAPGSRRAEDLTQPDLATSAPARGSSTGKASSSRQRVKDLAL